MAHTYADALREEAAAAKARGTDTSAINAELERIGEKVAEPTGLPEALGSPSAGDPLIGATPVDPVAHHAGQTEVKTAGGGSAQTQRASGRARRGQNESKAAAKPASGSTSSSGGTAATGAGSSGSGDGSTSDEASSTDEGKSES